MGLIQQCSLTRPRGCAQELWMGLFIHLLVIHLFIQYILTTHLRGADKIPAL